MSKIRSIHYSWFVVAGAWLIMFYGIGVALNTLSVFLRPIAELYGFSQTGVSAIITLASFGALFTTLTAGKIVHKIGCRKIMVAAGIIVSACFFTYSMCRSLPQFYCVAVIVGLAKGAGVMVPVTIMVNRWFYQKEGLAMGIALSGSGFGSMVFTPVFAGIIEAHGVVFALRIQSIVILLTVIAAGLLLRESPQKMGLLPYGLQAANSTEGRAIDEGAKNKTGENIGSTENVNTLQNADEACLSRPGEQNPILFKTPEFAFLSVAAFFVGVTILGINNQVPSFLTSLGYDPLFAAGIVSVFSGILIGTKILYGFINDKLGIKKGTTYIYVMWIATSISLLLIPKFGFVCFLFPLISALGNPIATVSLPLWTTGIFGRENYDKVYPVVMTIYLVGQALGTVFIGLVADLTGRYTPGFAFFALITAVGYIMMMYSLKRR